MQNITLLRVAQLVQLHNRGLLQQLLLRPNTKAWMHKQNAQENHVSLTSEIKSGNGKEYNDRSSCPWAERQAFDSGQKQEIFVVTSRPSLDPSSQWLKRLELEDGHKNLVFKALWMYYEHSFDDGYNSTICCYIHYARKNEARVK